MDCKNAYLINGVDYMLCRKVGKIDVKDAKSVAHAVCPHQKFCPTKNCHIMAAGWDKCKRLVEEKPVSAAEVKKTTRKKAVKAE